MRTIIHLSDLHFGRVNLAIVAPILAFIKEARPDLVAISGDLTQRARVVEFEAAREFLEAIPFPKIVVPGNHDVPLHNLFSRFYKKLDCYRWYIDDNLAPFFRDDEIAVLGVNTARALTWKNGRINQAQIAIIGERFRGLDAEITKIVVTHHPLELPAGATGGHVVGRSHLAMKMLEKRGVDLLLAGHFHIAHVGHTAVRYRTPNFATIVVSSGTSTSTRGRGQPNSLNVIRAEHPRFCVEQWVWLPDAASFVVHSQENFARSTAGWTRE